MRGRYTQTSVPSSVRDVDQAGLVGNYRLTDNARSFSQYHADVRLLADNKGWIRELMNGKTTRGRYPNMADEQGYYPVHWSYDRQSGHFSLDWSLGGQLAGLGRFSGMVAGNTERFSLNGRWSSGKAASIRLERLR